MNNAMVVFDPNEFETMQRVSKALVMSGYFQDAKDAAQAFVKVQAGKELGIPPVASMSGIHVVKGKPTLGANIIATLIKNDPRYNYRVLELNDTVCRIQFYEDGEKCGVSEFTAADAQKAGTQNMHKFPRNMLFARAISNGAKWFVPGVFGGVTVYTPEELGVDVDEDGDYIEADIVESGDNGQVIEPVDVSDIETLAPDHEPWEPLTDSQIVDIRSALEAENGKGIELGRVNLALMNTGYYNSTPHAMNAVKIWPGWEDAPYSEDDINGGLKVKTATALQIFDWAVARKVEPETA